MMNDRVVASSGDYRTVIFDQIYVGSSLYPYKTDTSERRDQQRRDVYDVITQEGNMKTPTRHAYTIVDQHYLSGNVVQKRVIPSTDGLLIYSKTVSGTSGVNVNQYGNANGTSAYNACVAELYESIRGGIDLSIDSLQAKQTATLIRSILSVRSILTRGIAAMGKAEMRQRKTGSKISISGKKIPVMRWVTTKSGRRVRKITYVNPLAPIRDIGSKWLEYHYGLIPTLSTIHSLVLGEATRCGNSMQLQTKSGRKIRGQAVDNGVYTNMKNAYVTDKTTYMHSVRYEIGGSYTPSSEHIESLSRLTSLNPLSIAWELLPFSFVADWFIDVGGYLRSVESAMVANLGTFTGYLTATSLKRNTQSISYSGALDPETDIRTMGSRTGSVETKTFDRGVLTNPPYPKRPSFHANLGSGRLLNAAALISQLIKR